MMKQQKNSDERLFTTTAIVSKPALSVIFPAVVSSFVLSACSSPSPGGVVRQIVDPTTGSSQSVPSDGGTAWQAEAPTRTFDPILRSFFLSAEEYQTVDDGIPGIHPYTRIGVDYAYGFGLSGAGLTVAVLDDGFLQTHDEFDEKTISTFGAPSVDSHGTNVASIAIGERDAAGMLGVAHGSNVHLASLVGASLGFSPSQWTAATDSARNAGAVVQNNSWGFDDDLDPQNLLDFMTQNGVGPGQALENFGVSEGFGGSAGQWDAYASALNNFQQTGVIVFALSNDEDQRMSTLVGGASNFSDLSSSLPLLYPQLRESWISVINTEIIGSGNSQRFDLRSAPCGQMGPYCIAVDSNQIQVADSASTNNFTTQSGTSMGAPMISGAIALLAEAFPSHTPQQLTNRLLATADSNFTNFSAVGTVDFGNSVVRSYSDLWGLGFADLEAALQPIGVTRATTRAQTTIPFDGTRLVSGGSLGDSVTRALSGQFVSIDDALGGQFNRDLGDLTQTTVSQIDNRWLGQLNAMRNESHRAAGTGTQLLSLRADTYAHDAAGPDLSVRAQIAPGLEVMTWLGDDQRAFASLQQPVDTRRDTAVMLLPEIAGFTSSDGQSQGTSFVSTLQDNTTLGVRVSHGLQQSDNSDHRSASVHLGHNLNERLSVGLGTGFSWHDRGFVDGYAAEALATGAGFMQFARLDVNYRLTPGLTLTGYYENGLSRLDAGGLWSGDVSARSDSFGIGLFGEGAVDERDLWGIRLSQPLRVFDGEGELALPQYGDDGQLSFTDRGVSLQPSGREIRLDGVWHLPMPTDGMSLTTQLSFIKDQGHIAGDDAAEALVNFTIRF